MAILDINEYKYNKQKDKPHEVSELICLKCMNRFIGVYPEDAPLKDAECECGAKGYIIKTGQNLEHY